MVGWIASARLGAELRDISRQGPNIIETVVAELTGGQPIELVGVSITSQELGRRLDVALRDDFLQLFFQVRNAIAYGAAVVLELRLTFAARIDRPVARQHA